MKQQIDRLESLRDELRALRADDDRAAALEQEIDRLARDRLVAGWRERLAAAKGNADRIHAPMADLVARRDATTRTLREIEREIARQAFLIRNADDQVQGLLAEARQSLRDAGIDLDARDLLESGNG